MSRPTYYPLTEAEITLCDFILTHVRVWAAKYRKAEPAAVPSEVALCFLIEHDLDACFLKEQLEQLIITYLEDNEEEEANKEELLAMLRNINNNTKYWETASLRQARHTLMMVHKITNQFNEEDNDA